MNIVDLNAYQNIRKQTDAAGATLVAVSKTKPQADIMALYELGQRHFGENYVQELVEKAEALPKDIKWHYIGHLQRNKVKFIAPFVHLIHGVDSIRLLKEINKRAQYHGKIIDVLLQVHIASEETKHGFSPEELKGLFEREEIHRQAWVRISGLMGMATFTDDQDQVEREFGGLKELYNDLHESYFDRRADWNTLSMGMSGDYQLALKHGSNMLRIGSLLFGARS